MNRGGIPAETVQEVGAPKTGISSHPQTLTARHGTRDFGPRGGEPTACLLSYILYFQVAYFMGWSYFRIFVNKAKFKKAKLSFENFAKLSYKKLAKI